MDNAWFHSTELLLFVVNKLTQLEFAGMPALLIFHTPMYLFIYIVRVSNFPVYCRINDPPPQSYTKI